MNIITYISIILIALTFPIKAGNEALPKEAKAAIASREAAIKKIDEAYLKRLKRLREGYLRIRDLDAANAVNALIKATESPLFISSIINKQWTWRTMRKDSGNWIQIHKDGTGTFSGKRILSWRLIGVRTVEVSFTNNPSAQAVLIWDEAVRSYTGSDKVENKIIGRQKN